MLTKDFIYQLMKYGKQFIRNHYEAPEFNPRIALMSSFLTFACDFDKKGKCAGGRQSEMCCCQSCGGTIGYLGSYWPNSTKTLAKYARRFDKITGFWRKGKGCILPRELRSLTCSWHVCHNTRSAFESRNDEQLLELYYLVGEVTSWDYRHGGDFKNPGFLKATDKMEKAASRLLKRRNLHYDGFEMIFQKIKSNTYEDGWSTIVLENGRRMHINGRV